MMNVTRVDCTFWYANFAYLGGGGITICTCMFQINDECERKVYMINVNYKF